MDGAEEKNRIIILSVVIFSIAFLGIKIDKIPILGIEFKNDAGAGIVLILSLVLLWFIIRAAFKAFFTYIAKNVEHQENIIAASDQDLLDDLGSEADLALIKGRARIELEKWTNIRNKYVVSIAQHGWLLVLFFSLVCLIFSIAWTKDEILSMVDKTPSCKISGRSNMLTETFQFKTNSGVHINAFRHRNPDGTVGGVVAETARVHPTATVCYDAWVEPDAIVAAHSIVEDETVVRAGHRFPPSP